LNDLKTESITLAAKTTNTRNLRAPATTVKLNKKKETIELTGQAYQFEARYSSQKQTALSQGAD